MSIDYNQLFQIFFEESFELLTEMEAALLSIDLQNVDIEKINQTFRVMHTLKGNSSIINFSEITEFLHSTESYLDQVRHKNISLDEEGLKLLLDTVDTLRTIFNDKKSQKVVSTTHLAELQTSILKRLSATQGIIYTATSETPIPVTPSIPKDTFTPLTESTTPVPTGPKMPASAEAQVSIQKPSLVSAQEKMTTIRIGTEKIDTLINLVGELVILQSMLSQKIGGLNLGKIKQQALDERLLVLQQKYRQLQDTVLSIRMLPLKSAFGRFQRTVHDLCSQLGKKVDFKIKGEETEIDKQIIEKISDPLIHLIRNAIDHGVEKPEERVKMGKPPVAKVLLSAYESAGKVIIEVEDDGQGLDKEKILKKSVEQNLITDPSALSEQQILDLIFLPGFSTSEVISEVSGRGVGMDVVQKNIHDLGGTIEIETKEGQGSKFSLHLPLSISIMDCQLIKVLSRTLIIPLMNIVALSEIEQKNLKFNPNEPILYYLQNEYIPLIDLRKVLWNTSIPIESLVENTMIVIEIGQKRYGLVFDELSHQQQIFIKNLDDTYKKIFGLLGVTILGDGSVAAILDVSAVIQINKAHEFEKIATEVIMLNKDKKSEDSIIRKLEKPKFSNILWKEHQLQVLTFKIQDIPYALDISVILEIHSCEKITPIPFLESYVDGVTNVRGYIYPILNLAKLFQMQEANFPQIPQNTGMPEKPENSQDSQEPQQALSAEASKIIIIIGMENSSQRFAICIDALGETLNIKEDELSPLPEVEPFAAESFILGNIHKNGNTITLLDIENLSRLMRSDVSEKGILAQG